MQTEDSAKSTAFKYLTVTGTIGALIIRIGFWGPVYYNRNPQALLVAQQALGLFLVTRAGLTSVLSQLQS